MAGALDEVAGEGRNAVGLEALARLARREARHREHAAPVAGPFGRAAHPARERGPHLAAGAEDQDVGFEAGDRGDVFVSRLGEQVLELGLRGDFLWQWHACRS